MTSYSVINWTHRSVKAFARGGDPIAMILEASQALVLKALEAGWKGPPFNPLYIAQMLDVQVEANSSIPDARLVAVEDGAKVEFNPQQARERVRFSIAHELAHLFFPDWNEEIRNRGGQDTVDDQWQLEMLCNLAASEFVLPIGSLEAASQVPPIEILMRGRRDYDVSAEAFLIRVVKVSNQPVGVLFASPVLSNSGDRSYQIDYYISSPTASRLRVRGSPIPANSVIHSCTAIGHTDRAVEDWFVGSPTSIECVGIPGYPGSIYPRVAALVRFDRSSQSLPPIRILHGNILELRGSGPRLVCQLVNDRATRWGGGVARQMANRFPGAESTFTQSFLEMPRGERLGNVVFSKAAADITVASMIAQQGFGRSLFPRISYSALVQCLRKVTVRALDTGASVHMPRVGTGASGGSWATIEEMIDDSMVRAGLSVTVYDPPLKKLQLELF